MRHPNAAGGYGYGDGAVGFDLGHALNLALNPIAQMHAVGDYAARHGHGTIANLLDPVGALHGRHGGGQSNAIAPSMPPAPVLQPHMAQAGASIVGANTLRAYMGLGTGSFLSTGPTGNLPLFNAEPQTSFIGQRLIVAQAKTSGAAGILVTINQALTVSGMPQTPNPSTPAPVEMFATDATYSGLDIQIATAGTSITLGFAISTAIVSTGDSVSVSAGIYGLWIR